MARYELGWQKTSITAAGAIMDIASAASDRGRLIEIGFAVSAMTGTSPVLTVGLFRSTAVGTRTSPVTVLPDDPADPVGTMSVATAFSVAPTLATNPLRRFAFNAIGQGMVWDWRDINGLPVAASGAIASVVLNSIAVAGTTPNFTLDGWVRIEE